MSLGLDERAGERSWRYRKEEEQRKAKGLEEEVEGLEDTEIEGKNCEREGKSYKRRRGESYEWD